MFGAHLLTICSSSVPRLFIVYSSSLFFPLYSVSGIVGISLKVSWNRLVAVINWNRAQSVLGIVSSFVMLMAAPPMLFCSTCLVAQCAVQCRMRCSTVSSFCWHAGHVGESAFPMQCRCLANGACPVHSCIRMLACFLGMSMISLRYLTDTAVGSIFFRSVWHGEASHNFCACTP
jgi:hypothetical protein